MANNSITNELVEKINKRVDDHFRAISKIPRGSGNEKAISDYLAGFAKSLEDKGVTYIRSDHEPIGAKAIYDIVIKKPGTKGYEDLPIIILQAHIDMVCQKTPESTHDFTKDGIEIQVNDRLMTAKDTTLGADDGIGVACMMAILESDELAHPPIEALFTSDEEDDMTGAMAVTSSLITGKRLINIDTETEGIFYYGCAGGVNANFSLPIDLEQAPGDLAFFNIKVSGLLGGHSGVQIHERHANANMLIGRALHDLSSDFTKRDSRIYLAQLIGGDKKNVIAREANAVVGIPKEHIGGLEAKVQELLMNFTHEYGFVERELKLELKPIDDKYGEVLSAASMNKLLSALMIIPNGVLAMHSELGELVETSCNLGVLRQEGSVVKMVSFIRSFLESKKQCVVEEMYILAQFIGAEFSTDADFPNWEPATKSELVKRFGTAYANVSGEPPLFESIHAGLECGHFAKIFPEMDMIACGPTITNAHTTEETLDIGTTKDIVCLLLNVLRQMNEPAAEDAVLRMADACSHEEHRHICQCIL